MALRSYRSLLAVLLLLLLTAPPVLAQESSAAPEVTDAETDAPADSIYRFRTFGRSYFTHDRAVTALGIQLATPALGGGYSVPGSWKGVYYRNHKLEFSAIGGRIEKRGAADTVVGTYAGNQVNIGAHFQSDYRWGNRRYGVKGILLQPHLGAGVSIMSAESKSQWGLYVKPGFNIELPYCLADFSVLAGWYFLGNKEYDAGIRGFRVTPQLNLAVDALWDVLDPELTFQGTRTGRVSTVVDRTVFSREESDGRGGWQTVNYTRPQIVTTSFRYEAYTNEIPQLSGIFIRYGFNRAKPWREASQMGGLGYGLRRKMLVLDIYGEYGRLSSVAALEEKKRTDEESAPAYSPEKEGADPALLTTATAYRAMAKVGFNFYGLLYGEDENSFSRVVVGLMGGYQGISNIEAESPGMDASLDKLYTRNPTYIPGAYHDARLSEGGFAWGWWLGLEIGNVGLHFEWPKSKAAPLFTGTAFSINYLFPVKLIRTKLRDAES